MPPNIPLLLQTEPACLQAPSSIQAFNEVQERNEMAAFPFQKHRIRHLHDPGREREHKGNAEVLGVIPAGFIFPAAIQEVEPGKRG